MHAVIGERWPAAKAQTFGRWLEETRGWLHNVTRKSSSKCAADTFSICKKGNVVRFSLTITGKLEGTKAPSRW